MVKVVRSEMFLEVIIPLKLNKLTYRAIFSGLSWSEQLALVRVGSCLVNDQLRRPRVSKARRSLVLGHLGSGPRTRDVSILSL